MTNHTVHSSIDEIAVIRRRRRHAEVPCQIALRSPRDHAADCTQQKPRSNHRDKPAIPGLLSPPGIKRPSDDNGSEQQELSTYPEPVGSDRALNVNMLMFDGHLIASVSVSACYGERLTT